MILRNSTRAIFIHTSQELTKNCCNLLYFVVSGQQPRGADEHQMPHRHLDTRGPRGLQSSKTYVIRRRNQKWTNRCTFGLWQLVCVCASMCACVHAKITSQIILYASRYPTGTGLGILIAIIRIENTAQWPDPSCALHGSVHTDRACVHMRHMRHKRRARACLCVYTSSFFMSSCAWGVPMRRSNSRGLTLTQTGARRSPVKWPFLALHKPTHVRMLCACAHARNTTAGP